MITVLKSKLHLFPVTGADLNYEGSCAIDKQWMEEVGIRPFEQIHIFNQNNGARLITYAIESPSCSRVICLNGAAARLAAVGDRVIIVAYEIVDKESVVAPRVLSYNKWVGHRNLGGYG